MNKTIQINDKDNIVVAIKDLKKKEIIANNIEIKDDIGKGHKIAISDIKKGENIIKYGYPIGQATEDI